MFSKNFSFNEVCNSHVFYCNGVIASLLYRLLKAKATLSLLGLSNAHNKSNIFKKLVNLNLQNS